MSESEKSPIERMMAEEFGEVPQTPVLTEVVEAPDPVPQELRKLRGILKRIDVHVNEFIDGPHRAALRRQAHLGRGILERLITEIETGKIVSGPLVGRRPR